MKPYTWMTPMTFGALLFPTAALASYIPEENKERQIILSSTNDIWAGQDANLSNDLQLAIRWATEHPASSRLSYLPSRDTSVEIGVQHQIYTPKDRQAYYGLPYDRPYVGYLSGYAQIYHTTGASDRYAETSTRLAFGRIGPDARGQELQDFWHTSFDDGLFYGWDNQLQNDWVWSLSHEIYYHQHVYNDFFISPFARVEIGNWQRQQVVGGEISWSYGPNHLSRFQFQPQQLGWTMYLGGEHRWVDYDRTLTEGDFGSGALITPIDKRSHYFVGMRYQRRGFSVQFERRYMSRDFREQTQQPSWGQLKFQWNF